MSDDRNAPKNAIVSIDLEKAVIIYKRSVRLTTMNEISMNYYIVRLLLSFPLPGMSRGHCACMGVRG